ncbi:MAG: TMEM175 family protein [Actinomycetota bacterium]|nr:TMEM175 family protein [Actinomycetota bacterium]
MLLPHRGLKEIHTGRDFERLINFSDAVVAVAITVLVLAIVDIRPRDTESSVWQLISDNAGQIFTFFFTFLVVGMMWLAHNRVVNQLRGFDGLTFWLNLFWLAGIAFLPWPSSLYGEGFAWGSVQSATEHGGGTGSLYWGTLAVISGLAFLISWHARHTPELLEPKAREAIAQSNDRGQYRGLVFCVLFLAIGLVSTYSQEIAGYMAFLIIPASIFVRSHSPLNDIMENTDS